MARRIQPATAEIWRGIARRSFAILGYVTPAGEPRSSGIVYRVIGRRLYTIVGPDSWKARHIARGGRVAVTVPIRRGGLLSLIAPHPARHDLLPRGGGRASGRVAQGSLALGGARAHAAPRASRVRVPDRDRAAGRVRDVCGRRAAAQDAGRRGGARTGAGGATGHPTRRRDVRPLANVTSGPDRAGDPVAACLYPCVERGAR